jgi:hypothetical protein
VNTIDPSNLNQASIAVESVAGVKTITRKATNVGPAGTYTPSVTNLAGWSVTFNPSSLTFAPGETKTYQVTFTRTSAPLNNFSSNSTGAITWTSGATKVRSPVLLRAVTLGAPAQVTGTGAPLSYPITFGFSGAYTVAPRGLVAPTTTSGTVPDDPGNSFSRGGPGTVAIPVAIPGGTTYARFSLFQADATGASDLDLYVYNSANTLVGLSGGTTADEEVNLTNPAAGNYTVYVHGYQTDGPSSTFKLYAWTLPAAAAGNMSVTASPPTGTIGGSGTVNVTFNGLSAATKYLGSVVYGGGAATAPPTIVRIDTP